ncbi:MAG: Gfo/Idh/MocA family oxidoreductase [Planctomycetes bacterium]|nr:Gfo/Idh/MocA family oxidoreductase [Planctomycetota bacterium]
MNVSPEAKAVGRDNYYEAVGVNRREFLQGILAGGAVAGGAGLGAAYFGYGKVGDPLRVGVIGTGDEGNVLLGAMSPEYLRVVAISDIRPSSIHRAFFGDWASPVAIAARPGLLSVYGWTEQQARENVRVYDASNGGYQALLADPNVEAVVIALPLHLHAKAAIDAMKAGKHVLTEKLMAHNVAQCKIMTRFAREKNLMLAVGHQRHYSILYDNAVNLLRWGLLGEVHHIRAQWHRGNLPGRDSWQQPVPGGQAPAGGGKRVDPIAGQLASFRKQFESARDPREKDELSRKIVQWEQWDADKAVKAEDFGYITRTFGNLERSALEELVRWRLFERTGGGLMAELGSHQLDAASIFISALRRDGKKAHPLSVHAVGGRHLFANDRDSDDHVYCMFEFPGPGYDPEFPVGYFDPIRLVPDKNVGVPAFEQDPEKRVVVTYSSINGNGFGGYGEVVMGTRGTLVLEREQEVMVYQDSDTSTRIGVKSGAGGPSMDTQASGNAAAVAKSAEPTQVSRGYREELEHWAYCIRNPDPANVPRCRGEIALGDAVIALAANIAMNNSRVGLGGYLPYQESWFDVDSDDIPSPVDPATKKAVLSFEEEHKKLMG